MNPIAEVEAAIATGGWSVYLKLAWKLLPWILAAVLLAALLITRGTLHNERQEAKLQAEKTERQRAEDKAAWALDGKVAAESYANKIAARQPLLVKSTDTVREYAQTAAGRAPCATPDRVQGIDALDRSLFPGNASGVARTVPADAGASAIGRIGK